MRKPIEPYENNKVADQSAHPQSLISTFVLRCLANIIPILFEISKTQASLCNLAGQFESYLVTHPRDWFSHDMTEVHFATLDNKIK